MLTADAVRVDPHAAVFAALVLGCGLHASVAEAEDLFRLLRAILGPELGRDRVFPLVLSQGYVLGDAHLVYHKQEINLGRLGGLGACGGLEGGDATEPGLVMAVT